MNKFGILFFIIILITSCSNDNSEHPSRVKEIEPNSEIEYAQFIDKSSTINATISNTEGTSDVDYYMISSVNSLFISFSFNSSSKKDDIIIEIIEDEKIIATLKSEYIKNYDGDISSPIYKLKENSIYYISIKLADNKDLLLEYSIKFDFYDTLIENNEIENNNSFKTAQKIINFGNVYSGSFIKYSDTIYIEDAIKTNLASDNIIDIDIFKIENTTDIDSSIKIEFKHKLNATVLLFDENYFLKGQSKYSIKSKLSKNENIYIVVLLEDYRYNNAHKYSISYSLY